MPEDAPKHKDLMFRFLYGPPIYVGATPADVHRLRREGYRPAMTLAKARKEFPDLKFLEEEAKRLEAETLEKGDQR